MYNSVATCHKKRAKKEKKIILLRFEINCILFFTSKSSKNQTIARETIPQLDTLKEIGKLDKPVMLKRGMAATIKEWLLSAEYIMNNGNHDVILCERGVRTFGEETRNTMDLSSIPLVQQLSHLPVIADPSHGTGRWELVIPVARAAAAVGADGIMVEVHPHPENALSDGPQSLKPNNFRLLMDELDAIMTSLSSFEAREKKIAYK